MAKWASPPLIKTRATAQGLGNAKPQMAVKPKSTKNLVQADIANGKPISRIKKGK